METMGNMRRTVYCGRVSMANVGQELTVCGSVAKTRDKGGIIFTDLRDTTGILQLVFDEDTAKDVFAKAEALHSEYVVICKGLLRERASKTDKIKTGDVELYVSELRILSDAETTPVEIRDEIKVKDELRLKYRYLDLRRPAMHEPLVVRSEIMRHVRNYFYENDFTEIETPNLIGSTPEGARDYVVPSRVQPGNFYALPQSPQLYKQILMLSGFDRYFQIARCFRDEDLRADRQPEFTQIDEELSFVDENDVMTINEGLMKKVWKEVLDVDIQTPFDRMPWEEAMDRFGSDKPETRMGLELCDVTGIFAATEFVPFKATVEAGGTIRAINAKGLADQLTRKKIDKLVDVAKLYGAKGLAYTRMTADGTTSSFEKNLTDAEKEALHTALGAEVGDVLLLVSDAKRVKACTALGQVRLEIGRQYGLIDPDKFNFLWVTTFPLFEYDEEEGRYSAVHHPFTMPTAESMDKLESDPGACYAEAYDIVLNGCELGGGSIRINNPELQNRMFKVLGFTEERARASFGYLMDAYKYGAPPHGGMAYGLDRMVMLMLGRDSIRDVIAFPKVQNGGEIMTSCPSPIEQKQYDELCLKTVLPVEKEN
ncbi:MAG: aspartate--tRNA ligase [Faecalibacterium sp.]